MYNLIIIHIHNLGVSKKSLRHNSRTSKDSRVHSGFKQTNNTNSKNLIYNSCCIVFKSHKHLCLHCKQFQLQKTTTFHYVCPQFFNVLPLRFWYLSTATFTELYVHICSVCHVAKHLCTKITQNLDCLLQQDIDHLPISRLIKQAVSALKTFLAFNILQSGEL